MRERLSRVDVDRQLREMWEAVASCDDETGQAAKDALRIEADLLCRLAMQDRLDDIAPELLDICKRVASHISESGMRLVEHGGTLGVYLSFPEIRELMTVIAKAEGR